MGFTRCSTEECQRFQVRRKVREKNHMKRGLVTGEYDATEYRIFLDGEEVYSAGNAPGDSQAIVSPESGVGLATMKRFCIQTAKEIAAESGARYGGVTRTSNRNPFRRSKMKHRRKHHRRKTRYNKRRAGAYARFAKAQWAHHRAKYKRMGFKRAGKAIGALWRRKHPKRR